MRDGLYRQHYELESVHWWFTGRRRVLASMIEHYVHRGAPLDIVDVGCGTGMVLKDLEKFGNVIGIDSSPLAIELCRKRGITNVGTVEDLEASYPGSDDGHFDLMTMLDVIEHIEDDGGFIDYYVPYIRPGGHLIVTVPAFQFLWGRHDVINEHYRRYVKKTLVPLLTRRGLEPRKVSYFNSLLSPPVVIARLFEKLAYRVRPREENESAEFGVGYSTGPLNGVLAAVFGSEGRLLKSIDFPFGISLMCIAQRTR